MAEKQPGQKARILQICHDYKGPFRTVARQYAGSFPDCEFKTVFLRGPRSSKLAASISGDVEFLNLPSGSLRGLKLERAGGRIPARHCLRLARLATTVVPSAVQWNVKVHILL